jgi:hypothetical protein
MPALVQKVATAPPATPAPPLPPATPGAYVVNSGSLPGAMMSRQEIAALQARRSELNGQLESANRSRRQLSEQLRRTSSDADRSGLESRLTVLDTRIARIEGELDEVGQQLASPAAARVAGTQNPFVLIGPQGPRFNNVNPEPIIIAFTVFVLSPIALSIARLIWRRGSRAMPAPANAESTLRLERMEQAMDAIAIEIERVSEGQRFVTRLLSERSPNALGAAQQPAEPMRVPLGNASPTR